MVSITKKKPSIIKLKDWLKTHCTLYNSILIDEIQSIEIRKSKIYLTCSERIALPFKRHFLENEIKIMEAILLNNFPYCTKIEYKVSDTIRPKRKYETQTPIAC